MFYRKTDTEILCETLIKLADKQERFTNKYGITAKSPFSEAMHVIMVEIENHLHLASATIGSPIPKNATNKAPYQTETPKMEITRKKRQKKTQRFFNGTKPPIQVIHGHSNDPENKTIEDLSTTRRAQIQTMTPPAPVIKEAVTPDNIDDLAAAISEEVEPKIIEQSPTNSYNFPHNSLN